MISTAIDTEADVAVVEFLPGQAVVRTERVGPSLLANYAADGRLVNVEVLSLNAVLRADVAQQLRTLIGAPAAAALRSRPPRPSRTSLFLRRPVVDYVDVLRAQVKGKVLPDAADHQGLLAV